MRHYHCPFGGRRSHWSSVSRPICPLFQRNIQAVTSEPEGVSRPSEVSAESSCNRYHCASQTRHAMNRVHTIQLRVQRRTTRAIVKAELRAPSKIHDTCSAPFSVSKTHSSRSEPLTLGARCSPRVPHGRKPKRLRTRPRLILSD